MKPGTCNRKPSLWTEKERAAWQPRARVPVGTWARDNVYLTTKMGAATPGGYDPDLTPWVHDIFAALTDPDVERVIWVAASQIGKTLTMEIYTAYTIDQQPQNIIYFMDNDGNARWHSAHRIQPLLDGVPALAGKVQKQKDRSRLEIGFVGGVLNLGGANSASQLASKSAAIVIRDETSKWPEKLGAEAGALELAGQRVRGQYEYKLVDISTPVQEGDPILKQFAGSDRRYYYVPCPLCGGYQPWEWKQVKWPQDEKTGHSVEPEVARGMVWYECGACGGRIEEWQKAWMVGQGKWIGAGEEIQEIENRFQADWSVSLLSEGREKHYVKIGPRARASSPVAGFHINRLYSPFVSWGQMAEEWLEIGEDLSQRQNFYNGALALPWKEKSVDLEKDRLREHIDRTLPLRIVPEGYEYIIAGADYHGPRYGLRFVTLAVRRDFALAVIDYGELGSLEEFGAYMRTPLARQVPANRSSPHGSGSGEVIAPHFGVCDAGWETKEVIGFCAAQPRLDRELHFITPIQSAGGVGFRNLYTLSKMTAGESPHRRSAARQGKQIISHPEHWKNQMLYQLTEIPWLDKSEPPPAGYVRFHRDCGDDLFEELTSEKRIERVDKRTGRKKVMWVVVKKTKTHSWDALCYARAAADLYLARFAGDRRPHRRRIGTRERS